MGSITMYLHYGRHVTGISGSATHMASTLADAAARAPRMHCHTIIATDSVHQLAADDCEWRPLHGGHALTALVDRQQQRKTPPMLPNMSPEESRSSIADGNARAAMAWRKASASVRHLLPHDVDRAREVTSRAATPDDGSGASPP